ncbi:hypothetical protein ACFQ36_16820, partial [Arthrobacter sp. GCM10027362]
MSEKRRGLGRGLGALIPSPPAATQTLDSDAASVDASRKARPVDLFFPAPPARGDGQADDGAGSAAAHVAEVLRAPRRKPAPARRTPGKKPAGAEAAARETSGEAERPEPVQQQAAGKP